MNITVTDNAQRYLAEKIAKENGKAFRLSIKKTGCSGYSYHPEMIQEILASDILVTLSNNLCIYVDSKWLSLLNGVQIDYVEESKLGLKQKKLIFNNPNETNRCGCGESFHVEQN